MYILRVRNFQSIKSQDFKFKGFVAITGPSNLGKSAVRRAIGAVCYNDWDAAWQRKDSETCIVKLEKPSDGLVIKMTKSEKNGDNCFELKTHIGEQTFAKVGRSIPEEISSQGFNLLTAGDESFNLQVTTQLEQLFMVTYNSPTNTKILNKIFNVSKLEKASDLVVRDAKKLKVSLNSKTSEYNEKTAQLEKITAQHDDLESRYNKALYLFDNVEMADEFLSAVTDRVTMWLGLSDIDSEIEGLEKSVSIVNKAKDIADFIEVIKTHKAICESVSLVDYQLSLMDKQADLINKSISITDYVDSVSKSIETYGHLNHVETQISCMENKASILNNLLEIESFLSVNKELELASQALKEVSKYDSFIDKYDINKDLLNHLYHREKLGLLQEGIDKLDKEISDLSSLAARGLIVSQIAVYLDGLEGLGVLSNKISQVDIDISSLEDELSKMPRCKECGQIYVHQH